ncbi:hypothetical protein L208DRAFT_1382732 [Tricholoma matsutake]|nr:hypothetical protein L208DRAFT_1382732 [Tricholoma matsutake 945]
MPSTVSSLSFIWQLSIASLPLGPRSLLDEPAPECVTEPSTIPSLSTTPVQPSHGLCSPAHAPSPRVLTPKDDKPDRFLNIELDDLQPHLDYIHDAGLVETLKHGIGYFHEALDPQDKRIVQCLFESSAAQVLVVSKDTAQSLPVASYMVIIMDQSEDVTVEVYTGTLSLTKLKGLLEVVPSSAEFVAMKML